MTSNPSNNLSREEKIALAIVILLLAIPIAAALPSLPTEFYGRIRDYNQNASAGNVITMYDSSNNLCATFTVVNAGFYGVATCPGDDPETNPDEGLTSGENVSFRYNGNFVTVAGNYTWGAGIFQNVNLTYPVVYCGDLFCDAEYETNYTCPQDCPNETGTINVTTNNTLNISVNQTGGGGGTGGAGTGEGAGGGGGGGGGAGGATSTTTPRSTTVTTTTGGLETTGEEDTGTTGNECQENWACGAWSKCSVEGLQNRTCVDKNNCGSYDTKPSVVQQCAYNPTCSDGIQNGLEEGLDCGGLCPPCISCFDGIQNCHDGKCEEDVDCGGPCKPCASCYDGIKNCPGGVCEEGPDCGGPCEKACPQVQAPKPLFACQKDFNPMNNRFIVFFILALIVIISYVSYSETKVHGLKASRTFTGIERAKKMLSYRRREFLFTIIVILLSAIIYLYYYFFVMCETDFRFLWMLLLLLLTVPIVLHEVIRILEYNEMKKLMKLQYLALEHELQIRQLIAMHNENLVGLLTLAEEKIRRRMYSREPLDEELLEFLRSALQRVLDLRKKVMLSESSRTEEELLRQSTADMNSDKYSKTLEKDMLLYDIAMHLRSLVERVDDRTKLYDELQKLKKHQLKVDLGAEGEPSKGEKSESAPGSDKDSAGKA